MKMDAYRERDEIGKEEGRGTGKDVKKIAFSTATDRLANWTSLPRLRATYLVQIVSVRRGAR
jgi:hypothetical protein